MRALRLVAGSIAILTASAFVVSCSKSDSSRLTEILNISMLPPSTTIEKCGEVERDGGLMWDCLISTNAADLDLLMSGHQFKDLNVKPPEHVYLATPKGFKSADWIHILYNENTNKASIATHAP